MYGILIQNCNNYLNIDVIVLYTLAGYRVMVDDRIIGCTRRSLE